MNSEAQLKLEIAAMEHVSCLPLNVLIPHYLIHSCLYYRLDHSIISDHAYDLLSRRIYDNWDQLEHRHKYLIAKEALLSGGHYIQFPTMALSCAKAFKAATAPTSYLSHKDRKDMARINSRSKGQRGEREIIDMLQPHVDEVTNYVGTQRLLLQRNTLQSDKGGYDIVGLPGFGLEVKRVETETPGQQQKWWEQTCRQASADKTEPVLFYRMNGKAWRVKVFARMILPDGKRYKVPAVIEPDHFIFYMKSVLFHHQQAVKLNS